MNNLNVKSIENIINYSFNDEQKLINAFSHPSYANEFNIESNQRLEYLGDSILNFVVAEALYSSFNVEEGQMSKWRSQLVNSDNLASIIESLKLDKYLLLGKSFLKKEVPKSVKEDLFESLVGAIYVDGGMCEAKKFINKFIDIKSVIKQNDIDYKSALQEFVQQYKGANLVYFTHEVKEGSGEFCAEIYINDEFIAKSFSLSKKQAQIECAKLALADKSLLKEILK